MPVKLDETLIELKKYLSYEDALQIIEKAKKKDKKKYEVMQKKKEKKEKKKN